MKRKSVAAMRRLENQRRLDAFYGLSRQDAEARHETATIPYGMKKHLKGKHSQPRPAPRDIPWSLKTLGAK